MSRDRLRLTLAGYLVGKDEWHSAKAIYDELAATSNDPAVLEASRRNLRVVDKQMEAMAESHPGRKEQLELELAALHHELGHEQASKRISRRLSGGARDETIRREATKLLETEVKLLAPPGPPGTVPQAPAPSHNPVNATKGGVR